MFGSDNAHAGGVSWSVGVDLPVLTPYSVGPVVGVRVGGGRGWQRGPGWRGHGYGHGYHQGWHSRGGVGFWGPSIGIVVPVTPWVIEREVHPSRVVEVPVAAALPVAPSRPDPVVYPRNGQSPLQTEHDRQQCDRWATTQPAAMADASVFYRSVGACMDGRGYTLR
ncbi:MAG: hypothetical protein ABIN96_07980 [Rubrivivax sp.]